MLQWPRRCDFYDVGRTAAVARPEGRLFEIKSRGDAHAWLRRATGSVPANGGLATASCGVGCHGPRALVHQRSHLGPGPEAWQQGGTWPDLPSLHDFEIREYDGDDPEAKELVGRRNAKLRRKNAELHSLRCDTTLKLDIAERFRHDAFYFPYNVDFRGRAYPLPPNLNHLGSDVCRAVLQFAEPKRLGDDGLYWLRVHLANLFGLAKRSREERHQFALDRLDDIRDSFTDPMRGKQWWLEAEEPRQAVSRASVSWKTASLLRRTCGDRLLCFAGAHGRWSCNGCSPRAPGRDRKAGSRSI